MKRFLTGIFAALLSVTAFGTTFTPIQLLNPAGSVSGQAIVSTGPTTVPAWGGVGVNGIAAIAANTVLANATGSSASPTAFAMPSCTGSTNALGYTSGTGIVCNGSINAATLGGATFVSPGPIGSTTPSTGAFTTLSASGNDALLYTNTSGQSIPNITATPVTGWTKTFDRLNTNFNAATGTFTAPATGYYSVSAQLFYSPNTGAAGTNADVYIVANGAIAVAGIYVRPVAVSIGETVTASAVVFLTSGQTVVIQAAQFSGGAVTLQTSASTTYVSINRLP